MHIIVKILLCYLVLVNLVGAGAVCLDKWKARRGRRRIRERTLFLWCWLGGCPLTYAAMRLVRHKTLHRAFMWGIPAIFLLQIVIISGILYFLYQKGVLVL